MDESLSAGTAARLDPDWPPVLRVLAVTTAVTLVLLAVAGVTLPSVATWLRSHEGAFAFAAAALVGFGVAVGVLGSRPQLTLGRWTLWLPSLAALMPVVTVLAFPTPASPVPGLAAWMVLVAATLGLSSSAPVTSGPARALALAWPSIAPAVIAGGWVVFGGTPREVSQWLLPFTFVAVAAAVVVIPGILIVEGLGALGGEGWVTRWLTPETYPRAWFAIRMKALVTAAMIGLLWLQGYQLAGWWQAAAVALVVVGLLTLDSFAPFTDLADSGGLSSRVRVGVTVAMGVLGLLCAVCLLILMAVRPFTLGGLLLVLTTAFVFRLPGGPAARIAAVCAAGALGAVGWLTGPTLGSVNAAEIVPYSVPGVIATFVLLVGVQCVLSARRRHWGFPATVIAVIVLSGAAWITQQRAGAGPVNLIILPALVLDLIVRHRTRRLIEPGEVLRWCLISVVAIDLTATYTLAPEGVQAALLGLSLLTLGVGALALRRPGPGRVHRAGLVCATFAGLVAALAVTAFLPDPSVTLLHSLDSLASTFVAVLAFPLSAALSAASARASGSDHAVPHDAPTAVSPADGAA